MASKIKVDNITDQDDNAVISRCGSTHTVTAEVYKADTIQDTSGNAYIAKCGTTVTLGGCGQTIELASGASQTGFGRTGTVDWDTTAKTASFTAVSGNGYFVNTTSGAITLTLPASPSPGDIVSFKDYANTFDTNNLTLARNGSLISGDANDSVISTEGQAITLIYGDATKGWQSVNASTEADLPKSSFIVATGGTVTCCGDYKIHTFTSPGTFCVSQIGNGPTGGGGGPNAVSYLVVAGGGGGGTNGSGAGGGAGGFREGRVAAPEYTASPLVTTGLTITASPFPITVGAGASGGHMSKGSNSVFSTITSAGGGGGNGSTPGEMTPNGSGGSGGGNRNTGSGGSGNTPPVSPPQGSNGGDGASGPGGTANGGGGGGAVSPGTNSSSGQGGNGGSGTTTSIPGSPIAKAGGGAGKSEGGTPGSAGPNGGAAACASASANTGGGGGGGPGGGNGGSGIVIIRYKFQ
jgi:hypothetical protein